MRTTTLDGPDAPDEIACACSCGCDNGVRRGGEACDWCARGHYPDDDDRADAAYDREQDERP